jgi:hypothetical protein
MSALTAEEILAAAQRAGWAVSPARAAEIAAAAGPRLAAFEPARAQLTFDDDAAGFVAALLATREGAAK